MDPKKQALSPDLKQIYDKVMSTQVRPQGAPPPSPPNATAPAPGAPTQPPAATTADPTAVSLPSHGPFAPAGAGAQSAPQTQGAPQPQTVAPTGAPQLTDAGFVFAGNKLKTPQGTPLGSMGGAGKKLSAPIVLIAIVVGIVVWGVAWAKIFGLF